MEFAPLRGRVVNVIYARALIHPAGVEPDRSAADRSIRHDATPDTVAVVRQRFWHHVTGRLPTFSHKPDRCAAMIPSRRRTDFFDVCDDVLLSGLATPRFCVSSAERGAAVTFVRCSDCGGSDCQSLDPLSRTRTGRLRPLPNREQNACRSPRVTVDEARDPSPRRKPRQLDHR